MDASRPEEALHQTLEIAGLPVDSLILFVQKIKEQSDGGVS